MEGRGWAKTTKARNWEAYGYCQWPQTTQHEQNKEIDPLRKKQQLVLHRFRDHAIDINSMVLTLIEDLNVEDDRSFIVTSEHIV